MRVRQNILDNHRLVEKVTGSASQQFIFDTTTDAKYRGQVQQHIYNLRATIDAEVNRVMRINKKYEKVAMRKGMCSTVADLVRKYNSAIALSPEAEVNRSKPIKGNLCYEDLSYDVFELCSFNDRGTTASVKKYLLDPEEFHEYICSRYRG